jgi:uncharacterized protein YjbI with pentapeptide repeats
MTQEELSKILEKHKKWLNGENDGHRLYLSHLELKSLDLIGIDLSFIEISRSKLQGIDFSNSKLFHTNLSKNDLSFSTLYRSNLSRSDLRDCDLTLCDLRYADLSFADLRGAKLNLTSLEFANLYGTKFDDSQLIRKGIYLKEKMIGYKKCQDGVIVTLEIPKGAIVYSINNSKCRTNTAKVVDIDGKLKKATSEYDTTFVYHKGKMVYPDNFDCAYNVECGNGIHFFRTREEAERCS